eukprot:m51a1_g10679 hypothetical protein (599) ;mRNA; r:73168-75437
MDRNALPPGVLRPPGVTLAPPPGAVQPLARACPALALPPGVLPTPQPLFFACAPVPLAPLPPGVLPPPYAHPAIAPGPAAAPAARKRAPVPVSTESVGSSTWRRVLCDTGHCYFYDTQTGRVAWALPPGVDYGAAAAETPLQPAQTPARGDGDSDGPGAAAEKRAREGAEGDEEEPAAKARRVEEEARQREEAEQEHQRCVETFKEMLREVGVAPFSQWDKELPKFVFDKRCSVLPPSERRAVFESFVRARVTEDRKEKMHKLKRYQEVLRQIFEELGARVTPSTTLAQFWAMVRGDRRVEGLSIRECDVLFRERIEALKKTLDEKRRAQRQQFVELLRGCRDIEASTRWQKAEVLLGSRLAAIDATSSEMSAWFSEYARELAEQERRAREQQALARRSRELEEREASEARSRVRRDEAVEAARTVLAERVKDHLASYDECRERLEADARWQHAGLSGEDRRGLFRDHVAALAVAHLREFGLLVEEAASTGAIALGSSLDEACEALRGHERYARLSDEERRAIVDKFLGAAREQARHDLVALLDETKIPRGVGIDDPDFRIIDRVLSVDKRYARMDSMPEMRRKVIAGYLETLAQSSK